MTATPTAIPDVLEILPDLRPDARGLFLEKYNKKAMAEVGIMDEFDQDNLSISKQWALRGVHFQKAPHAQTKLVSVIQGKVFDVAVDLRPESPTYGKWVGAILDDVRHNMLYIPKGFGHGFLVLSPSATFFYKCAGLYNKEASSGIRYDDPTLAISWPLEGNPPVLSTADQALPSFSK